MSSSPTISFVLHDVARLPRRRFEQRSRAPTVTLIKPNLFEARLKPAVDREKIHG
jgi:hypothetical protein